MPTAPRLPDVRDRPADALAVVEPPRGPALAIDRQTALPPPSWRRLAADAPAVTAAVEGLAGAFDLRPQPSGGWTVEHAGLAVRGELSIQADGASARVGLAIGMGDVDASSRALVLMSAASVGVGGVAAILAASMGSNAMSAMNFLGPLLAAAATFLGGLIFRELVGLWRRWLGHRWTRAYQRRLWPALDARLRPPRIYR